MTAASVGEEITIKARELKAGDVIDPYRCSAWLTVTGVWKESDGRIAFELDTLVDEYRDPVGCLMDRIYRGHVYGPHQRSPEVVRATAHAMLDGYIGEFA